MVTNSKLAGKDSPSCGHRKRKCEGLLNVVILATRTDQIEEMGVGNDEDGVQGRGKGEESINYSNFRYSKLWSVHNLIVQNAVLKKGDGACNYLDPLLYIRKTTSLS